MGAEAWAFMGTLVVNGCGLVAVWLKLRATNTAVDGAHRAAKEAAIYSEPTGNGFADEVREGFRDVGDRLSRLENLATDTADDIRNHKDAHVLESIRRHM